MDKQSVLLPPNEINQNKNKNPQKTHVEVSVEQENNFTLQKEVHKHKDN